MSLRLGALCRFENPSDEAGRALIRQFVLVREAGGYATDLDGGDAVFEKRQIIAGNEFLQGTLISLLKGAPSKE